MADNNYSKRSASAANLSGSSVDLPTPQHGTCYWCFRAAKWIPVLFIVAVISWSYYAYVIQLCFRMFSQTDFPVRLVNPFLFFFSISVGTNGGRTNFVPVILPPRIRNVRVVLLADSVYKHWPSAFEGKMILYLRIQFTKTLRRARAQRQHASH